MDRITGLATMRQRLLAVPMVTAGNARSDLRQEPRS